MNVLEQSVFIPALVTDRQQIHNAVIMLSIRIDLLCFIHWPSFAVLLHSTTSTTSSSIISRVCHSSRRLSKGMSSTPQPQPLSMCIIHSRPLGEFTTGPWWIVAVKRLLISDRDRENEKNTRQIRLAAKSTYRIKNRLGESLSSDLHAKHNLALQALISRFIFSSLSVICFIWHLAEEFV